MVGRAPRVLRRARTAAGRSGAPRSGGEHVGRAEGRVAGDGGRRVAPRLRARRWVARRLPRRLRGGRGAARHCGARRTPADDARRGRLGRRGGRALRALAARARRRRAGCSTSRRRGCCATPTACCSATRWRRAGSTSTRHRRRSRGWRTRGPTSSCTSSRARYSSAPAAPRLPCRAASACGGCSSRCAGARRTRARRRWTRARIPCSRRRASSPARATSRSSWAGWRRRASCAPSPGTQTAVAGSVELSFDMRNADLERLDEQERRVRVAIGAAAHEYGVTATAERVWAIDPVAFDIELVVARARGARRVGRRRAAGVRAAARRGGVRAGRRADGDDVRALARRRRRIRARRIPPRRISSSGSTRSCRSSSISSTGPRRLPPPRTPRPAPQRRPAPPLRESRTA